MRRLLPLFGTMLFAAASYSQTPEEALLHQYCTGCHNEKLKTGGLVLDTLDPAHPESSAETWEKVVRKVRAGMMPPSGARRPDRASLDRFAATIAARLDNVAAARPNPGTTGLRRLNRAEYANAIRDLLSLEIDVSSLLPADDSSEGFDNIADALSVSPALLERYVSAAEKISRLAVGDPGISPSTVTYRVPTDLAQADHIEGLPLGTRGGTLIRHNFPLDAGYAIRVRARGGAIGLGAVGFQGDQIEVTLDGERIKLVDAVPSLDLQLQVRSGPHDLGVAFVKRSAIGADDLWQIYANNSGIQNVAITGPLDPSGAGDSPSRRRIFVCRPKVGQALSPANEPTLDAEEAPCARKIVATLARRAYRQPVSDTDLETLMGFYQEGRQQGGFEAGVRQALARILVGPRFVFRFESDPESLAPGMAHRITDLELASRLSFFLWSSIPDNELLDLAIKDKLHEPATLEQQARRMLADPRSESLVTNFGGQWLYLRELKNQRPESKDFNENLREAFKRETELFFESIIREDHNVLDLLNADYTFVDEQLAHHYGIANVHGSRFRRVALPENRRGLLGQGSILLVTSVANRTSPVARGKWILENLMGSPPPLPPPNVPPLKESTGQALAGSVRQRMEEHRNNAACAACHKIMDPIGFSLENYDLIGKWRTSDEGTPIEASGELVDGTRLDGPSGLRQALLSRSDVFVSTLTEKLLTYALGRGVRYYDMPALRAITRAASENDHRFSSLISGIVSSAPFQMRRAEARLSAAAEPRPTGSSPTDKP